MKKQKIFDVVWSGAISNNWNHDSIVAESIADAEKRARDNFLGLKLIRSITDSQQSVWARG